MPEIRAITDEEFALFQTLIEREAGIHLSEAKKALLVGRLSGRLRELGLDSFAAYYRRVMRGDHEERVRLFDRVCTNATQFFREPSQHQFLQEQVFPRWQAEGGAGSGRRIRVWSAACSTGEEPYSIAMSLLSRFPPGSGWEIDVLATDLSTTALGRARAAVWPLERSGEIPKPYLKRFMLRGTRRQTGQMKAGPEVRSVVRFARLNLNDETYPVSGSFELIFCRNVLMYFAAKAKAQVIRGLLAHLAPAGHLLVGHAETLSSLDSRLRRVGPSIYTWAPEAGAREATRAAR